MEEIFTQIQIAKDCFLFSTLTLNLPVTSHWTAN